MFVVLNFCQPSLRPRVTSRSFACVLVSGGIRFTDDCFKRDRPTVGGVTLKVYLNHI